MLLGVFWREIVKAGPVKALAVYPRGLNQSEFTRDNTRYKCDTVLIRYENSSHYELI